ncbi:MAG TPA: phospholipase D-like domain-containing protein [Nocardioidaceae bacterium]|nr:phospholipase D-like domain-containing protein [Nocardioidaceae bacterium]
MTTTLLSAARRSVVVALLAGLTMALLLTTGGRQAQPDTTPAAGVSSWTPRTGAVFNRPVGTADEQRAIFAHVNRAIDATPRGATIRFAVFSFADKPTATRLINAHKRGVKVQLIFNGHEVYTQEKRLQQALGTNRSKGSFAYFCDRSCRGAKGQMHQKTFLFSKVGSAERVVMVGSNNMTRNNVLNQWSDIYTVVDDPALYWTYDGMFEQLRADRPLARPYINSSVNEYGPTFFPHPGSSQYDDPVHDALSSIECLGAAEGYGTETGTDADGDGALDRVTKVRIAQHAWNGDRGRYLVQKVAELHKSGCDVRVMLGIGAGKVVKTVLSNQGVPTNYGATNKKTHQKLMFVSGAVAGDPASTLVWTGSHNWSDKALGRDDVLMRIDSAEAVAQYDANFEDMWNNG